MGERKLPSLKNLKIEEFMTKKMLVLFKSPFDRLQ